jgi:hydroxymethylbilane synthase
MIPDRLRIGTRGSDMALAQTHLVRARLQAAWPELAEPGRIEIEVVTTIADKVLDRPLSAIGGKGLFTKELEQALLDGRIDLAVHSMKDVETWLPDGLEIACILPRDDPREAFLSHKATRLADLPAGSSIGTSSLRRAAQILEMRPDLRIAPLRGNANTRMRKLAEGECDATLLALCGLQRLGMADLAQEIIATADMLPSVAQGALDGSCRTPIAALAHIENDRLSLTGLLFTPDGSRRWSTTGEGSPQDAHAIGFAAGQELRAAAGDLYTSLLQ